MKWLFASLFILVCVAAFETNTTITSIDIILCDESTTCIVVKGARIAIWDEFVEETIVQDFDEEPAVVETGFVSPTSGLRCEAREAAGKACERVPVDVYETCLYSHYHVHIFIRAHGTTIF